MRTRTRAGSRASEPAKASMNEHDRIECEWFDGGRCLIDRPCVASADEHDCVTDGCSVCAGIDYPTIGGGTRCLNDYQPLR